MEQQILEILLDLQQDMKVVKTDIHGLKTDVQGLKIDVQDLKTDVQGLKTDVQGLKTDMQDLQTDFHEVKETVNRIEASQTDDVIAMLTATKKKTDFEFDYLNNKVTEIDKRLFSSEKKIRLLDNFKNKQF